MSHRGRVRSAFRADGPMVKVLALAFFLSAWEFIVAVRDIRRYLLPPPSAVVETIISEFPILWRHTMVTGFEALAGLGAAIVIGGAIAVLMAYSMVVRSILMPAMAALTAIPKVAFAPLLIVWFGIGYQSKVATAFLIAVFPIMVNSVRGLSDVEPGMLHLVRLMRVKRRHEFAKIRLPNALPAVFDGLRIALPLSIIGAIVAEFIAASAGLGYLIILAKVQANTALTFASITMIAVFSFSLFALLGVVERRVVRWRVADG